MGVGRLSPQTWQMLSLLTGRVVDSLLDGATVVFSFLPLQCRSCVLAACTVLNTVLHLEHCGCGGGGGGGILVDRRRAVLVLGLGTSEPATGFFGQNLMWLLRPFFLQTFPQKGQGCA